jgi:hypothetical protein
MRGEDGYVMEAERWRRRQGLALVDGHDRYRWRPRLQLRADSAAT